MYKYTLSTLLLVSSAMLVAAETKDSKVTEIKTISAYEDLVTRSTTPVVIDFFADWCQPCKKMAPLFEKLAKEYGDKVRFLKIDTGNEAFDGLIKQYSIRSIPTFVFKKGQSTSKRIGIMTETELRKTIEGLIAA